MSAFVVPKKHIDLMVKGILLGTRDGILPPLGKTCFDGLGQVLVKECVASVSYRYPNGDVSKGELPGPCDAYYTIPYRYADPVYSLTAPEMLGAINCYSYQSCEHPGWETCGAKKICDRVEREIRNKHPTIEAEGYDFDELDIALCAAKADYQGAALVLHAGSDSANALSDWLMDKGYVSERISFDRLFGCLRYVE